MACLEFNMESEVFCLKCVKYIKNARYKQSVKCEEGGLNIFYILKLVNKDKNKT